MLRKLCVNVFPIEAGQPKGGFLRTADELRNFVKLRFWDLGIHDRSPTWILGKNAQFAQGISEQLRDGYHVLNIGGDHSMGLATGHAFLHSFGDVPKKLIWVDAHADLNTRSSSLSGNMHGMPVSFLLGLDRDRTMPFLRFLRPEELIYIGIRDLDLFETETIAKWKITHFPSIRGYEKEIIKAVGSGNHLHISFDVDSLDPTIMPCTGTPVPHGLFLPEIYSLFKPICAQNVLRMVDITEYNLHVPCISHIEQEQSRKVYGDITRYFQKLLSVI